MQIFKKTHEKKLEIKNPISFTVDEIIESLEPGSTFVINGLFFYTINKDFTEINFYLMINDKCVSVIFFDVKTEDLRILHTKEIYGDMLKNNFNVNKNELTDLKSFIGM